MLGRDLLNEGEVAIRSARSPT